MVFAGRPSGNRRGEEYLFRHFVVAHPLPGTHLRQIQTHCNFGGVLRKRPVTSDHSLGCVRGDNSLWGRVSEAWARSLEGVSPKTWPVTASQSEDLHEKWSHQHHSRHGPTLFCCAYRRHRCSSKSQHCEADSGRMLGDPPSHFKPGFPPS